MRPSARDQEMRNILLSILAGVIIFAALYGPGVLRLGESIGSVLRRK